MWGGILVQSNTNKKNGASHTHTHTATKPATPGVVGGGVVVVWLVVAQQLGN